MKRVRRLTCNNERSMHLHVSHERVLFSYMLVQCLERNLTIELQRVHGYVQIRWNCVWFPYLDRGVMATLFLYGCREKRIKYDIIHNSNGTVTYKQNRTFHFVRDMSVGPDTDRYTSPNPVYWVKIHPSNFRLWSDQMDKYFSHIKWQTKTNGPFHKQSYDFALDFKVRIV